MHDSERPLSNLELVRQHLIRPPEEKEPIVVPDDLPGLSSDNPWVLENQETLKEWIAISKEDKKKFAGILRAINNRPTGVFTEESFLMAIALTDERGKKLEKEIRAIISTVSPSGISDDLRPYWNEEGIKHLKTLYYKKAKGFDTYLFVMLWTGGLW